MYKRIIFSLSASLFFLFFSLTLHAQIEPSEDSGALKAKGHGMVTVEGDGSINISGDGVLVVNENSNVTFIDIDRNEWAPEDGDCTPTEDGGCIYLLGIEEKDSDKTIAKVTIKGNDIKVYFAGANIGLKAVGQGNVFLKGYGIYKIGSVVDRWSTKGTLIPVEH